VGKNEVSAVIHGYNCDPVDSISGVAQVVGTLLVDGVDWRLGPPSAYPSDFTDFQLARFVWGTCEPNGFVPRTWDPRREPMGAKTDNTDTLLTLPVVLGVLVVAGGVAALMVSGFFVYRAHRVNVETQRMQESLQATLEQDEVGVVEEEPTWPVSSSRLPGPGLESGDAALEDVDVADWPATGAEVLKPGVRLEAQRPIHWDEAEIIDILEGHKIKVRWLSGEPGEDVIAAELVRNSEPATQ